jgi:alkaline phosphatase D
MQEKNIHTKKESQQLFLDFLDTPKDAPERSRRSLQFKTIEVDGSKIKIIVLETYFRTSANQRS